jgi:ATP-dependent Clp protease ATP-binding subunit ClpA
MGHGFIGTEHVLLGLLHEGEGVGAQALAQLGVTLDEVRSRVGEVVGLSTRGSVGSPPFTPRTKKVLELALREVVQLGHQHIETGHLLLALAAEGDGVAASVLLSMGHDMAEVRATVIRLFAEGAQDAPGRAGRAGWASTTATGAHHVTCSFCGRRPPDTGRLVASGPAVICEHCIEEWHGRLTSAEKVVGPTAEAHLVEPPEEPPPEEEGQ